MKTWKYSFTALTLILSVFAIAIFQLPDNNLHIIACDVGLGDAILITQGTNQILTDGGPGKSVLDCLGRHMPFWDREIEFIISTHPDADHSTGLVSVVEDYEVDKILINPIDPGTQVYEALKNAVGGMDVEVINPTAGMRLRLGLIQLDILNPTDGLINRLKVVKKGDNLSKYEISKDTNLYSIMYELSFGEFRGLFTGDIPSEVSDAYAESSPVGTVQYIKIPHHGSVNGLTQVLLEKTKPAIAVISVDKNQWGFPREEILQMLNKFGVNVLRTDQLGDIEITTDGNSYWID